MKTLIFASNNNRKLEEICSMIHDDIKVLSLSEINCLEELPETSDTLEGNALQKAQYVADKFNADCFADDTGLEVDALDGRPGVYSARYAGPECSPDDNMEKLFKEMEGVENRKARFRTVIASIIDGEVSYHEGMVEGEITMERSGGKGFGYDPVFKPSGYDITFAEMDMDEKNAISHRGRALRNFVAFLEKKTGPDQRD